MMTSGKIKWSLCGVCVLVLIGLAACFSPWKGEEGSLVINVGDGSRAAFTETQINSFSHTVRVWRGQGEALETSGVKYGGAVSFSVPPGHWNILVRAFTRDGAPAAIGETSVNVRAGANPPVRVIMRAVDPNAGLSVLSGNISIKYSGTPVAGMTTLRAEYSGGSEQVSYRWNKDGRAVDGASGVTHIPAAAGSYTVTVSAEGFEGKTSEVVIVGAAITLPDEAGLYKIETSGRYTAVTGTDGEPIDDLADAIDFINEKETGSYLMLVDQPETEVAHQTLESPEDGNDRVSLVLQGMNGDEVIHLGSDGALFTVKTNAGFTLNNIILSGHEGNTSPLVVVNGGEFFMEEDSVIRNNKHIYNGTPYYGGGVAIYGGGSFTMSGGEISGNSAVLFGGGVYVNDGSFTMSGGKISGNKCTDSTTGSGGGVYVKAGIFTKDGGTIDDTNTAHHGPVAFAEASPPKGRSTTAGPDDSMYMGPERTPIGWDN